MRPPPSGSLVESNLCPEGTKSCDHLLLREERLMMIGFVVNPIAGMGGRVALKGTDNVAQTARELGAVPVAPERAMQFLKRVKDLRLDAQISLLTAPRTMGECEVKSAGLKADIVYLKIGEVTTASDTKSAVEMMIQGGSVIICFVGGDGTARDVLDAIGDRDIPVVAIPSGVKMHSAVFAFTPAEAAELLQAFVRGQAKIAELEVLDVDEEAARKDDLSVKLYGYMKSVYVPSLVQLGKQASQGTDDELENQRAIAKSLAEEMRRGDTYIMGPGTTVRELARLLGIGKTLLGVDIYRDGEVHFDVSEKQILDTVRNWSRTWIVVSPIGRQGVIFGRGNLQISSAVLERVRRDRILVIATLTKISGIEAGVLRVDCGDPVVNETLKGYIRVLTDYREWRMMKVV